MAQIAIIIKYRLKLVKITSKITYFPPKIKRKMQKNNKKLKKFGLEWYNFRVVRPSDGCFYRYFGPVNSGQLCAFRPFWGQPMIRKCFVENSVVRHSERGAAESRNLFFSMDLATATSCLHFVHVSSCRKTGVETSVEMTVGLFYRAIRKPSLLQKNRFFVIFRFCMSSFSRFLNNNMDLPADLAQFPYLAPQFIAYCGFVSTTPTGINPVLPLCLAF
jgi:hypothetical protein